MGNLRLAQPRWRVEAARGTKSTAVCDGAVVGRNGGGGGGTVSMPFATTRPLELGGNGGGERDDEGGVEDDCI